MINMFDYSLELPPGYTKHVKIGVRQELPFAMTRQISTRVIGIRKEIGEMLAKEFDNTDVAKALRGQSSVDLPAHFGLTDSQANSLADDMTKVVRESIHIVNALGTAAGAIQIVAIDKGYGQFLALPDASYVAKNPKTGTAIEIPVIHWMLLDPYMDIGTGKSAMSTYEIVFSGSGGSIDARITKMSRSGRAIMKKLSGSGVGYVLPDIIRGSLGENFLEYALGQVDVAKKAARIFIKRMK